MGNLCNRCCPPSLRNEHSGGEDENRRLLSSPQLSIESGQQPYGSLQQMDALEPEQSNVATMMNDIIKVVESQVVDAGATDYNPLDPQEHMERTRFYTETVARRPLGPPALPVPFPRTYGNPASIIDAPLTDPLEIQEIRVLTKQNAALVQEMSRQEKDDLIAHLNQT